MNRRRVIALIAAGAVAVILFLGAMMLGRRDSEAAEHQDRQWPFDRDELLSLMDRVVADQRARLRQAESGPTRARMQAFLDYYERRRAAV